MRLFALKLVHSSNHRLPGIRAVVEHMPFAGHRTVAQVWADQERSNNLGNRMGREMSDIERRRDAVEGSARLLEAIRSTSVPVVDVEPTGTYNRK